MTSGEPIKHYTIHPATGQYQVYDGEIYDAFGQKAKPITPEVAVELSKREMYSASPSGEIELERIQYFFDRTTGKPLIYCYCDRYPDSCVRWHFFATSGYDPASGAPLTVVSPDIIRQARLVRTLHPLANPEKGSTTANLDRRPYNINDPTSYSPEGTRWYWLIMGSVVVVMLVVLYREFKE